MSGKSRIAALKDVLGDGVGRVDVATVPLSWIWPHPRGHALRHPRIDDPVDEALRDDVVENGITEPFTVRVEYHGKSKKPKLALNDGSRRHNAGHAAVPIMRKRGSKHLNADGELMVKIRVIKCSDAEFLLERQRLDRQPWKREHSVRVLADTVLQFAQHHIEPERMLDVLPREWTLKVVAVVSEFWHTADEDLRARLDRDPPVPPGLLPALLKEVPEDRLAVLEDLLEARVTSVGGATRALRARAERAGVDEGGAPDIEEDGLDSLREPPDDADGDEEDEPRAPAGRTGGGRASPRTGGKPLRAPVEAAKPATVRRLAAVVDARAGASPAERAFALGARAALDRAYVKEHVVPLLESLEPTARAAVAGVLWRGGVFDASVQRLLPREVVDLVQDAQPSARPAPPASKRTRATDSAADAAE